MINRLVSRSIEYARAETQLQAVSGENKDGLLIPEATAKAEYVAVS